MMIWCMCSTDDEVDNNESLSYLALGTVVEKSLWNQFKYKLIAKAFYGVVQRIDIPINSQLKRVEKIETKRNGT